MHVYYQQMSVSKEDEKGSMALTALRAWASFKLHCDRTRTSRAKSIGRFVSISASCFQDRVELGDE